MSTKISEYTGNVQGTDYTCLDKINFTTAGIINGYMISGQSTPGDENSCFLKFFVNNGGGGFNNLLTITQDSVICGDTLQGSNVLAGDLSIGGVLIANPAGDSPVNPAAPAGYVKASIGGSDAWIPFFQ